MYPFKKRLITLKSTDFDFMGIIAIVILHGIDPVIARSQDISQ